MPARAENRFATFALVAALAAMADQGIKVVMVRLLAESGPVRVAPFLDLRLGYNTGVSFGIFAETFREAPWLLAAIMIGIVVLIAVLAVRSVRQVETVAFALVAGGAIGNIIDRFRLGAVVDYLDAFYGDLHWPTFNFADVLISLGVFLLILASLFAAKSSPETP